MKRIKRPVSTSAVNVTVDPAAGAFIAILFMLKYPVGPKEYELIVKAVEDKKAGKDVDEAPFAECLK